jgi:hypothetical protein
MPEREALPVCLCPWLENPYRLVSLLDMLRFHADDFCYATSLIGQIYMDLQSKIPHQASVAAVRGSIIKLKTHCEAMGLAITSRQIKRVEDLMESNHYPGTPEGMSRFGRDLAEINSRLVDELKLRHVLMVDSARVEYFEQTNPLFGPQVEANFPSAAFDTSEAGKCYALYRSTACVFHLMRVLEIGLAVLAKEFHVPSGHTNWHNIIEGVEKAIREIPNDPARPPDWKHRQEFFSQIASHFMVIKDAWRNYTAHARGKYTEDEAQTLLINVRGFMQKLATRLHE